jgi:putative nucleotidyltransferase with HDIG domain
LLGASRAVVRAALADLNTPGLSLRIQRVAEATAHFLLAEPQAYPTLVALMELDLDTYNHSTHAALYTTELARAVGMTDPRDLTAIGRAALLHDVGKAGLPVEVLRRERPLTADERREVDAHTTRGVQLMRDAGMADPVSLDVCASHHERCDGSGHPRGVGREEISIQSRIVAIADVFDNLTSLSARRPALSGFQALWRMKRHMAGQFDADLLDAFVETLVDPASRS